MESGTPPGWSQRQKKMSFNSLQTGKHMESVPDGNLPRVRLNAFQFPSNGKAHGKHKDEKRCGGLGKFQFPSNGKAHGKQATIQRRHTCLRQFQFPSNGKAHGKHCSPPLFLLNFFMCFNSLQTGKHMESLHHGYIRMRHDKFQFPSNGKAHGKPQRQFRQAMTVIVSIPFKRESTWKGGTQRNYIRNV